MVKCLSCGGTFTPILADGTQYFHACPTLAAHEIVTAIDAGTLALSPADARRYQAAIDADTANPPAPGAPSRAELVLLTLQIERPNKRDENVIVVPGEKGGRARAKADGLGVVDVPPAR